MIQQQICFLLFREEKMAQICMFRLSILSRFVASVVLHPAGFCPYTDKVLSAFVPWILSLNRATYVRFID